MMKKIVAAFVLAAAGWVCGAIELGSPFADGMVLQRDREVPVWGCTESGGKVTVSFAGNEVSTTAGADGRWSVRLPAMKASKESRTLVVRSGAECRRVTDVLVGEVWYVSGQSNAECPLWNNSKDGNNPRFRDRNGALVAQMTYRPCVRMCYASNYRSSATPRQRAAFPVKWEAFTPETLAEGHGFSAIGVYYALEIHDATGIPVGIVGSYWGGTRIEPWIPAEGFESVGMDPSTDALSLKTPKGVPRATHQLPSRLWNEMVNPFAPMAMRGLIWYQGCSNVADLPVERYTRMMHALYNGWSRKFENPSMRLYFVQLAPWRSGGHPEFQQAQQRFADEQPNAAMAVINDLGNLTDIHPNEKEPVARRLAVHALRRDYGFAKIENESPRLRSWRIEGDRFVMTFDHAESFYIYNERYCSQENGFEICGEDGVWKPGRIHRFIRHGKDGSYRGGIAGGNVLEVSADGVVEPKRLRYLYSRPWYGSIYNEVCLPLGSFHIGGTDRFSRVFDVDRPAAGSARMVFTCSSPKVTRFEVEVNGVWTGSVAVPPVSGTNSFSIAFDAGFEAGANRVRVYGNEPVVPDILAFRADDVRPTPGLETAKWQAAIDAAATAGGGRVVIPAGRHRTGGLVLRSNVELHLEKGAVLEGAYGLENYRIWSLPCSEGTWSAIVAAVGVTNVAITGEGEIFGNGDAWPLPRYTHANQEGLRARGLFFADSKNVRLEDFLLRDTACWGCVFKCVDGVTARRVRIDNHSNYNNDGFDIEAANALFDSCDVDSSDDGFVFKSNNARFTVENILVTNCVSRSHCNAYKFGTASHGTMRGVRFVDCKALPPRRDFIVKSEKSLHGSGKGKPFWAKHMGYDRYPAGCGIASLVVECVDGGRVEDILFENIELSGATVPIFIRGGTRAGRHNAVPPGTERVLRNITLRNIRGEAAGWIASSVSGVDGCRVEDVRLENVDILCRGAGAEKSMDALRRPVPDVSGGYPEATMFRHILPAYGLYVDKTDGLVLENVRFRLRDGEVDYRPPVAFEKGQLTALEALLPRPVKIQAGRGMIKSWRALSPRIVKAAIEGAPPETADQAYRIELEPDGATVTAPSDRAAVYARATLAQLHKLTGKGIWMPCCTITDWPRYPYRGWMIDTARNFTEVADIKAVLDQMAACKMNLFHWHITEYYGWRLESKKYPELQKDESFYLRDIGKFYTQAEFKEVVDYAGARGITVMPEFDVPGHALAFRRAFGFKTMRDEGVREKLCDLVDELCSLVPADRMPLIHLGTDEARLPEEKVPEKWMQPIVDRVLANGRKVVGWVPGELRFCDLGGKGVAMRWGRVSEKELSETKTFGAFDGGGYYVETFDPFELPAVATYRRTCPWDVRDNAHFGIIACCWHDEYAGGSANVIRNQTMMPAIAMLSDPFWCGREEDEKGFYRRLPLAGDPRLARAERLERRMAMHRDLVYSGKKHPFQFLRQTDMRWKVTVDGEEVARDVAQATVFLWLSNTAGVEGAGTEFGSRGGSFTKKRSGTAVLETWIRSPKTQRVGAWIGFTAYVRDHGRALSGGTPPPGKWGRYDPTVEINGEKIAPPRLKCAGLKPGAEVKHLKYVHELDEHPYSDEEYYMRDPLPITLKEGWNHVKLTVPCKWCGNQAPWVATFVPLLGTTEKPLEVPGLEYRSSRP